MSLSRKYVALLRKINVGGQNLIKMDALREAFEAAGLKNVRTFQQAGNIVFESNAKNPISIAAKVERHLSQAFNTDLRLIVFSLDYLARITKQNPFKRVKPGDVMLCVVFLFDEPAHAPKLPLTSTTDKLKLIAIHDRAAFVVARRKKTGWFGFPNNFVEKQLGVTATTRQWSTIKKLIDFAERLF
jgi:uncharacterized protein (DUF1697 family)